MQNLEVKKTIEKIKNTKSKIKKELEEPIVNGNRNENTDMQKKSLWVYNQRERSKSHSRI